MRFPTLFTYLVALLLPISLVCQNAEPLGDAARRLRKEKESSLPGEKHKKPGALSAPNTSAYPATLHLTEPKSEAANLGTGIETLDPERYEAAIRRLLAEEQFDELDRIAARARATKTRFPGGGWKLYTFYRGLCGGSCEVKSDSEVTSNIEHLKHWVAAKPESVSARVALADAYFLYAWRARGDDYSDLVDEPQWALFHERLQAAREILDQASALKEKCPQWFLVMQHIARGQQVDVKTLTAIVEQASSFEPLYYYYYSEHAYALQPRWYGEEGDSERYAAETANRLGEKQGAMVYFEIARTINCTGCAESKSAFSRMSWLRIQEGYAALEELYGTSTQKLNEFAHLAIRAEDRATALKLFMRIGDNWSKQVWHTRRYFESSRNWAILSPPEFSNLWQAAAAEARNPEGAQYLSRVLWDFEKKNASPIKQCLNVITDDTAYFVVAMKLDKDGEAQEVSAWPPTRLSACIVPKLSRHALAPPPQPSYWILLPIRPKPPVMRMQGSALPEAGS